MKCKKMEEAILTDYIDGNLTGEALRDVEAHLASCENCRALAGQAAASANQLKSAGMQSPPEGLWDKIRAGVAVEEGRPAFIDRLIEPVRYFFTRLRPVAAAVAAAALVIFALTTVRLMPGSLVSAPAAQDDIIAIVSSDDGADETECSFGTALEEYFL